MITKETLEQLVKLKPKGKLGFAGVSVKQEVAEHRYIDLHLPRGSGKTTAMNDFASGKSVLKLRSLMSQDKSWLPLSNVESIIDSFRGIRFNGLKYQYILIDEFNPNHTEVLSILIQFLIDNRLLTDDFMVISLHT